LHEPMLRRYQPGRRIVLLHAFVKRTEAIRQSDLDVARTRKPAG
jgi:phage-related protein